MLATVLVLTATVLIRTFSAGIETRQARVVEARDRLASYEINKKILDDESVELHRIKERVEVLQRHIVTTGTIPELLSHIETVAKAQEMSIAITSVQNGKTLTVDFSGEGTMPHVEAFLDTLLAQPYQIRFIRFGLYRSGDVTLSTAEFSEPKKQPRQQPSNTWKLSARIEIMSY